MKILRHPAAVQIDFHIHGMRIDPVNSGASGFEQWH
jgi:hypothetical protein